MPSVLNDALEWFDRAEQAREVAERLTDPAAREAVIQLAEHYELLARGAAAQSWPEKANWPRNAGKGTRNFPGALLGLTASTPKGAVDSGSTQGSLTPEERARIIQIQDLLIECFVGRREAAAGREEDRVNELEADMDRLLQEKKEIERWAVAGSA